DAVAGVLHRDDDLVAVRASGDEDDAAFGRVPDGVADQVLHDLHQPGPVANHPEVSGGNISLHQDAGLAAGGLDQRLGGLAHRAARVVRLPLQVDIRAFEAGELEQVIHQ